MNKLLWLVLIIGGIELRQTEGQAQSIRFFREKIEMDVTDSVCTIEPDVTSLPGMRATLLREYTSTGCALQR